MCRESVRFATHFRARVMQYFLEQTALGSLNDEQIAPQPLHRPRLTACLVATRIDEHIGHANAPTHDAPLATLPHRSSVAAYPAVRKHFTPHIRAVSPCPSASCLKEIHLTSASSSGTTIASPVTGTDCLGVLVNRSYKSHPSSSSGPLVSVLPSACLCNAASAPAG